MLYKGITQIYRLNQVYMPGARVGVVEAKSVSGGLGGEYKSPQSSQGWGGGSEVGGAK